VNDDKWGAFLAMTPGEAALRAPDDDIALGFLDEAMTWSRSGGKERRRDVDWTTPRWSSLPRKETDEAQENHLEHARLPRNGRPLPTTPKWTTTTSGSLGRRDEDGGRTRHTKDTRNHTHCDDDDDDQQQQKRVVARPRKEGTNELRRGRERATVSTTLWWWQQLAASL